MGEGVGEGEGGEARGGREEPESLCVCTSGHTRVGGRAAIHSFRACRWPVCCRPLDIPLLLLLVQFLAVVAKRRKRRLLREELRRLLRDAAGGEICGFLTCSEAAGRWARER